MKNKLYAIIDKESGLFVTRQNRLEEFSPNTKLFKTRTLAMRYIEQPVNKDLGKGTILVNELAWDLLEKLYGMDRWHIDCTLDELKDAMAQFRHLSVVRIDFKYE